MLPEKKHARVAVTLIVCVALLMSGGVSPVSGETLAVGQEFKGVTASEFMTVKEPEFMESTVTSSGMTIWTDKRITEPETAVIIEKPEFAKSTLSSSGTTIWTGKRKTDPEVPVLIEELELVEVAAPEFSISVELRRGVTTLVGTRENLAYLRCAKYKGFTLQQKCARDALGMTQEKIDKAVGEYVKAAEEGSRQWE